MVSIFEHVRQRLEVEAFSRLVRTVGKFAASILNLCSPRCAQVSHLKVPPEFSPELNAAYEVMLMDNFSDRTGHITYNTPNIIQDGGEINNAQKLENNDTLLTDLMTYSIKELSR